MRTIKTIGFYGAVALVLLLIVYLIFGGTNEKKLTYSEVLNYFKNEEVTEFNIDGDLLTFTVNEKEDGEEAEKPVEYSFELYSAAWFWADAEEYIKSAEENERRARHLAEEERKREEERAREAAKNQPPQSMDNNSPL